MVPEFAEEPPHREIYRFVPLEDMLSAGPLEYIVPSLIPKGSTCVLAGLPGGGKSLSVHSLAVAIAGGVPWCGREVQQGTVALVAAEGLGGLGSKLRAAISPFDEAVRARIHNHLWILADAVALHDSASVTQFIEAVKRLPFLPTVLIFDTVARCMVGADENSAQDMGRFVQGIDRIRDALGCSIILLHHTTKDGSIERGSSALRGAVDVLCFVKLRDGIVTIEVDKARDFEPPKPMTLRLVPEGDSVRLEALDHQGFAAKARCAATLAVLRKAGGWVALQKIKQGCAGTSGITVERHIAELFKAGAIEQRRVGKNVEYRVKLKAGGAA